MEKVSLYLLPINKDVVNLINESIYINEDDLIYINKSPVEKVRNEKLLSLYLKRKYIGEYYLNESNKPLSRDKYFNISHTDGLIGIAISNEHNIGLDIELIKEVEDKLKDYISSKEERLFIKDNECFYKVWTNKESLVKANGSGIIQRVNSIPSLPLEGIKEYKDKIYYSKNIKYKDYIISITLESNEDYEIEIYKDEI